MEKFWMIVDVSITNKHTYNGPKKFLPTDKRPCTIYLDEDLAKRHLIRFKTKFPTGEFVLLEAMAVAVPVPQPAYELQALDYPIPF